ncbi:MAG: ammonium transporter, partial [Desulfatitalea sp.]|nr:ammonium transporter [Desulfatitalea sp.]
DPVGAISVHMVNGVWGTLAAGLFNMTGTSLHMVGVQLLGIFACFVWTFPLAYGLFKLLDKTVGLRVSPEEELEGLDLAEHGGVAYPDFGIASHGGIVGIPSEPAAARGSVGASVAVRQG